MAGSGNKHDSKVPTICHLGHENTMRRYTKVLSYNTTANQNDQESVSEGKYQGDIEVFGRVVEQDCF